jgi:hypothetical protein
MLAPDDKKPARSGLRWGILETPRALKWPACFYAGAFCPALDAKTKIAQAASFCQPATPLLFPHDQFTLDEYPFMNTDQIEAKGAINDPETGMRYHYSMRCNRVTGGWSCAVRFNDGQREFAPKGTVYLDAISLQPDPVATAALEMHRNGR